MPVTTTHRRINFKNTHKQKILFLLIALTPFQTQAGTSVPFTVNLSEPVTIDTTNGTPQIDLTVGEAQHAATYTSGTGSSILTFTYTTTAGDLDLDGITLTSPITTNNATFQDSKGNVANLAFTLPNTSGIAVNHPSIYMNFLTGSSGTYIFNDQNYSDFASFLSDANGTFSRASTATYMNSSGILQTAAANTPRFDHDASSPSAAMGLLTEETRTNRLRYSEDFTNALWTSQNILLTANTTATTAPDGTNSAEKLIRNTGSTQTYILQDSSITSGQTYIQSFFVKASELQYAQIGASTGFDNTNCWANYNLTTGTVGNKSSNCTPSIQTYPNGWYRIVLKATATSTSAAGRFFLAPLASDATTRNPVQSGNGTSGIYLWGAQLEVGQFITSYIQTIASTVTRAADSLTIPTGSWYNATKGLLFAQSIILSLGSANYPGLVSIDDGTANNAIQMFVADATTDAINSQILSGGSASYGNTGPTYTANATIRQALSYSATATNTANNGSLSTVDTSTTIPTVTTLRIGSNAGASTSLNGYTQIIRYYPAHNLDTQTQLLTQ